jgi:DNA-binding CsgD family transcriptional regulator
MEGQSNKPTTSLGTDTRADAGGCAAFLSRFEWKRIGRVLEFSPRESEIAALLLASHSDLEVASMLGISSHTVHSHLERLYRKLGVRSRSELLLRIFETYVHFQRLQRRSADHEEDKLPVP